MTSSTPPSRSVGRASETTDRSEEVVTLPYEVRQSTVRVHLADAPTDVLVYLVGLPVGEYRSVAEIFEAVAPADTVDTALTVAGGLRTLLDLGYAGRGQVKERTEFWATTAGRLAVAEAVARDASQPEQTYASVTETEQSAPSSQSSALDARGD